MNNIIVTGFYHFTQLDNLNELKAAILQFCHKNELKGTILIAPEGINGSVSGYREQIDKLYKFLSDEISLNWDDILIKDNFTDEHPFEKMKVKIRKEIVTMGVEQLDIAKRGEYVEATDWDDLINDPEVILVDTRNDYEVLMGSFEGAVNPFTRTFREFPEWVQTNLNDKSKKIAMCCTGGVRCEKSTSYLKNLGFENVYHLKGGILEYLRVTKNQNNKWQGDCFVFDDRLAVNADLDPVSVVCKECNAAIQAQDLRMDVTDPNYCCASCRRKIAC